MLDLSIHTEIAFFPAFSKTEDTVIKLLTSLFWVKIAVEESLFRADRWQHWKGKQNEIQKINKGNSDGVLY